MSSTASEHGSANRTKHAPHTLYVATTFSPAKALHPPDFTPWPNSDDDFQTRMLAGHKAAKDGGYFKGAGPRPEQIDVYVYTYNDDTPKHPCGRPIQVDYVHLRLTRK